VYPEIARGNSPVINSLGYGEARARPQFPPSHFTELCPRPAPVIPAPPPKGGRLGNGQLRRQVAEWLAARPGPHTVGEVAKALGRSAGAVGNALATLADRNEADRDPGKPVRYWANAKTGAAAAAITPKAPSAPKAAAAPKPAASPAPPAAPKPATPPAPPAARNLRPGR
jgi:hypothetical protein